MSLPLVNTLFHPFYAGEFEYPGAEKTCLVFGAHRDFQKPAEFNAKWTFVQSFKPDFAGLEKRGFDVRDSAPDETFDVALILAGKHRGQNERWLAQAVQHVKPDGLIVLAGGKTEGAASLRKRIESELPLGGHLSKNHGVVFWLKRSAEADAFAQAVIAQQQSLPLIDARFEAAPGMFSYERIDIGSRLLADNLPKQLHGVAADFCAGWGYLSVALAQQEAVARVDMFEADRLALEAAERNMQRLAPAMEISAHWCDLTSEKVERIYDLIVMNPPFHEGRAADPLLGQSVIRTAAAALKPRGRLFMVANKGLPYEPLLKSMFASCDTLIEDKGYRVYAAVR
ncbi:MAG: class I SAM-dependent methyltransferase [Rhizobiaceae bacterium]|nr:class I SAM-dependent methyltransferase [Rhizobiaceae bacterium]